MLYGNSQKYARILIQNQYGIYHFKLFEEDRSVVDKIKPDVNDDCIMFHQARLDSKGNLYQVMMSEYAGDTNVLAFVNEQKLEKL